MIRESADMKLLTSQLRKLVREELDQHFTWDGDTDPRPTPTEKEFVDGPDTPAGFIIVKDAYDHTPIAYAPIVQTDGPDRPFLVRTTDTRWVIPFWTVRLIYPKVQDAFNAVDSKHDWHDLGPGDTGTEGEFEWEWVESEPMLESVSKGSIRLTRRQLKVLVESAISVSAEYDRTKEDPKRRFEKTLVDMAKSQDISDIETGSPAHIVLLNAALDATNITDIELRKLISRPYRMIPPAYLLSL